MALDVRYIIYIYTVRPIEKGERLEKSEVLEAKGELEALLPAFKGTERPWKALKGSTSHG